MKELEVLEIGELVEHVRRICKDGEEGTVNAERAIRVLQAVSKIVVPEFQVIYCVDKPSIRQLTIAS